MGDGEAKGELQMFVIEPQPDGRWALRSKKHQWYSATPLPCTPSLRCDDASKRRRDACIRAPVRRTTSLSCTLADSYCSTRGQHQGGTRYSCRYYPSTALRGGLTQYNTAQVRRRLGGQLECVHQNEGRNTAERGQQGAHECGVNAHGCGVNTSSVNHVSYTHFAGTQRF